ncbi:MAG TPA: hypothetical protein VLC95_07950, partial [Anaerolineae bacterium]|nr:hypothetical protein [Anaerolineae bacterium]
MKLSGLSHLVRSVPAYGQLTGAIEQEALDALVDARRGEGLGIISAARPYVVAALYQQLDRPLLILTARSERVGQWVEQLRTWTGTDTIYPFPEPDALPYERVSWSRETVSDRLSALTVLTRPPERGAPVIVASARAVMQQTTPLREFRLGVRHYRTGQEIDLQRTLEGWVANGYRPDTVVEEPGTFNRRGGLVDVYPPNLLQPVRIELFGDEIDSMRLFDPTTQRTIDQVDEFLLAPATEALPRLAQAAARRVAELDLTYCHGPARSEYQQDLAYLEAGSAFRGIAFYLPFFYSHPAMLLDYLPPNGLCLVDDWDGLMAATVDLDRQAQALQEDLARAGELPRNFPRPYFTWDEIRDRLHALRPLLLGGRLQEAHPGLLAGTFQHGEGYGGQLKRLLDGFQEMRDAGERVVVVSRQARRIAELLEERDTVAVPVEQVTEPPPAGSLTLVHGTLAEGWVLQAPSTG